MIEEDENNKPIKGHLQKTISDIIEGLPYPYVHRVTNDVAIQLSELAEEAKAKERTILMVGSDTSGLGNALATAYNKSPNFKVFFLNDDILPKFDSLMKTEPLLFKNTIKDIDFDYSNLIKEKKIGTRKPLSKKEKKKRKAKRRSKNKQRKS